jgi:hypothetical protein
MSKGTQAIFGTIPRFKKALPGPSIPRMSPATSLRSFGPATLQRFTGTASLPDGRRQHSHDRG